LAGEPVDVTDFLHVLTAEGVLDTEPDPTDEPPVDRTWQRCGRLLFSPVGWAVQVSLALAGAVAAIHNPSLRPHASDIVVAGSPLASVLVMSLAAVLCTLLHEAGHVLAAAARGIPSRLSIGRRLYFLTAQADLTALWSLPRAQRLPPLLAGLSVDAALTGTLILAQTAGIPAPIANVLAATVVLQVAAIVFQAAIFMRTDLYAVLATLSGSRNLWALKTATFRQAIGRPTTDDHNLLTAANRRERSWAIAYLALYLPGLAAAGWYLIAVSLPGLGYLITLTAAGLTQFNLGTLRTWESLAAIIFIAAPTAGTIAAAAIAGVRSLRASLENRGQRIHP
ncbi:MAG TPA: hypothetical protein VFP34_00145, partial [Microlunatus sp.]|nr:hypothetical protein [Microlunatus sp.]